MKKLFLVLALLLNSCIPPVGTSGQGFWDQHVVVTAWGINMVTMYGPITIGYISWQRNHDEFKPAPPGLPFDQPLR